MLSAGRAQLLNLQAEMIPARASLQDEIEQLCATARSCYGHGWVPATSGNFSMRWETRIFITPTGLDKGTLTPENLLEIDMDGVAIAGSGRPSAEVSLHTVIYRQRVRAGAVLHVHTVWNTLLSARCGPCGHISIQGYELLKGLSDVTTHEHLEKVPVIENTQNYTALSDDFHELLTAYPEAHGILLSRHGLYTWGESVSEARRHLETLEFLFEVEGRRLFGQS